MTNEKLYLPFYFEWMDAIETLGDDDYGRLVKGIFNFARNGCTGDAPTKLSPPARMAYHFITTAIRHAEKNRINGRKGGLARAAAAKRMMNDE